MGFSTGPESGEGCRDPPCPQHVAPVSAEATGAPACRPWLLAPGRAQFSPDRSERACSAWCSLLGCPLGAFGVSVPSWETRVSETRVAKGSLRSEATEGCPGPRKAAEPLDRPFRSPRPSSPHLRAQPQLSPSALPHPPGRQLRGVPRLGAPLFFIVDLFLFPGLDIVSLPVPLGACPRLGGVFPELWTLHSLGSPPFPFTFPCLPSPSPLPEPFRSLCPSESLVSVPPCSQYGMWGHPLEAPVISTVPGV